MKKLQGTFVVMVTPFTSDGKVDYRGIRRNIEWWIEQSVHGLIPLGSTGEFASLSDAQKMKITETVMETVSRPTWTSCPKPSPAWQNSRRSITSRKAAATSSASRPSAG